MQLYFVKIFVTCTWVLLKLCTYLTKLLSWQECNEANFQQHYVFLSIWVNKIENEWMESFHENSYWNNCNEINSFDLTEVSKPICFKRNSSISNWDINKTRRFKSRQLQVFWKIIVSIEIVFNIFRKSNIWKTSVEEFSFENCLSPRLPNALQTFLSSQHLLVQCQQ